MGRAKAAFLAFVGLAAVTGVALYPLCNLLHRCGCAAPWAFASLTPALLLAGGVLWLATDYPHFLALHTRARLGVPDGPMSCCAARSRAAPRPSTH